LGYTNASVQPNGQTAVIDGMAGMRYFDKIPKEFLGSGMAGMRKSFPPILVSFNDTESK
jgi:hypothetical protein